MWYVVVFILGFAGGWAFFKHRAKIKAKTVDQIKAEVKSHL